MSVSGLNLSYFYAHESEQYAFFRIPKLLISDERYKPLSSDAKILYGLMLDRMGLSVKKGWLDEEGRVYIYYPLERACNDLNRSINTVSAMFKELTGIGLIIKKRQGQGKPDMIYVMNFASGKSCESRFPKSVNQESQNLGNQIHNICESRITESVKPESQDLGIKTPNICESLNRSNKTEDYKTEYVKTSSSPPAPTISRTDEDEVLSQIDREELIRSALKYASQGKAVILVDTVLEALRLLGNDAENRRLLDTVSTETLTDFISELVNMDTSRVGNLTAYLKRVLIEYIKKSSLRGVTGGRRGSPASYDLDEIERWIKAGAGLHDYGDNEEDDI